ncbi:MAG: hypothetical protein HYU24_12290 [Candidatus Rokubacteria bacterium]|nr:hypothetical protein [Candidatus Rokubacteria bacterium]
MQLQLVEARDPQELESAFSAMTRGRAGAFVVLGDQIFLAQRRQIVNFAAKGRLLAIFWRREFVEDGGFMAYDSNLRGEYRRAGDFVDKILP